MTYWQADGQAGLRSILNRVLGQHIIDVHDFLARNAYLQGALVQTGYVSYAGSATNFNTITNTDLFDISMAADIQLGMKYREVSQVVNPAGGAAGSVICYTTPGVIYDIQRDPDWIDVRKYQDLASILNYEVGMYKNVRFVESPRLTLWNCGAITYQGSINAAAHAGDGVPDPATTTVDGTYHVGQTSAGIVHMLYVSDLTGTLSDLKVNDIVTIHVSRTASFGVTNGVNPFDGKLHNRRVVAIGSGYIQVDKPIMEDFSDNLGAGVYGYVTKGMNVHSSIFVGGPQGIVAGLAQPIRMHTPPPIDDLEAIYRYSWNSREGFQPYAPEVFEVIFSAGSTRVKGGRTI